MLALQSFGCSVQSTEIYKILIKCIIELFLLFLISNAQETRERFVFLLFLLREKQVFPTRSLNVRGIR